MTSQLATARSWLPGAAGGDHDDSGAPSVDGIDWLVAIAALLFPLAYFDAFFVPSFTPRMVLVLLLLPAGAFRLIRAAWGRDAPSLAAAIMLAACAVATLVADVPLWNLRGGFGRESSLVFIGGIFALWALARESTVDGCRLITTASLCGLAATGLIGCLQLLFEPMGFLQMIASRPSGLMVNPVYFGPSMAGAAVFVAHLLARRTIGERVGAGAIVLFVACANLSGSRAGMIGLTIGVVGALIVAGTTRSRLTIGVSTVFGLLGSTLLTQLSGGRDTLERAVGGSDGRWQIWNYAWDAFRERPLRGHGLGQFRPAVQTHFEPEFVAEYLAGTGGVAWPDAHNVIVQYTVVGGIVATSSLLAFVFFAGRAARGPATWATLALTVSWLLQPVTLVTAPIAAIWLGVASASRRDRPTAQAGLGDEPDLAHLQVDGPIAVGPRVPRRTDALLVAVGALVALTLLGLDRQLDRSLARGDVGSLTTWADVAPDDPVIAGTTAGVNTRQGSRSVGLEWSARAVRLEPRDAVVITDHAIRLFDAGRTDESVETIWAAIEVDPYNPYALRVAAAIGSALDDEDLIMMAQTRGCQVVDELCDAG